MATLAQSWGFGLAEDNDGSAVCKLWPDNKRPRTARTLEDLVMVLEDADGACLHKTLENPGELCFQVDSLPLANILLGQPSPCVVM